MTIGRNMHEGSTFEVTAQSGRKGLWRISLDAEALTLAAVDGDESFQISRTDAEQRIALRELRFIRPLLVVSISKTKVVFLLEQAQAASYTDISQMASGQGPPPSAERYDNR